MADSGTGETVSGVYQSATSADKPEPLTSSNVSRCAACLENADTKSNENICLECFKLQQLHIQANEAKNSTEESATEASADGTSKDLPKSLTSNQEIPTSCLEGASEEPASLKPHKSGTQNPGASSNTDDARYADTRPPESATESSTEESVGGKLYGRSVDLPKDLKSNQEVPSSCLEDDNGGTHNQVSSADANQSIGEDRKDKHPIPLQAQRSTQEAQVCGSCQKEFLSLNELRSLRCCDNSKHSQCICTDCLQSAEEIRCSSCQKVHRSSDILEDDTTKLPLQPATESADRSYRPSMDQPKDLSVTNQAIPRSCVEDSLSKPENLTAHGPADEDSELQQDKESSDLQRSVDEPKALTANQEIASSCLENASREPGSLKQQTDMNQAAGASSFTSGGERGKTAYTQAKEPSGTQEESLCGGCGKMVYQSLEKGKALKCCDSLYCLCSACKESEKIRLEGIRCPKCKRLQTMEDPADGGNNLQSTTNSGTKEESYATSLPATSADRPRDLTFNPRGASSGKPQERRNSSNGASYKQSERASGMADESPSRSLPILSNNNPRTLRSKQTNSNTEHANQSRPSADASQYLRAADFKTGTTELLHPPQTSTHSLAEEESICEECGRKVYGSLEEGKSLRCCNQLHCICDACLEDENVKLNGVRCPKCKRRHKIAPSMEGTDNGKAVEGPERMEESGGRAVSLGSLANPTPLRSTVSGVDGATAVSPKPRKKRATTDDSNYPQSDRLAGMAEESPTRSLPITFFNQDSPRTLRSKESTSSTKDIAQRKPHKDASQDWSAANFKADVVSSASPEEESTCGECGNKVYESLEKGRSLRCCNQSLCICAACREDEDVKLNGVRCPKCKRLHKEVPTVGGSDNAQGVADPAQLEKSDLGVLGSLANPAPLKSTGSGVDGEAAGSPERPRWLPGRVEEDGYVQAMAAAAAVPNVDEEPCGFCYANYAEIVEPKTLRCCSRSFCKACLVSDFSQRHGEGIYCPWCGKFYKDTATATDDEETRHFQYHKQLIQEIQSIAQNDAYLSPDVCGAAAASGTAASSDPFEMDNSYALQVSAQKLEEDKWNPPTRDQSMNAVNSYVVGVHNDEQEVDQLSQDNNSEELDMPANDEVPLLPADNRPVANDRYITRRCVCIAVLITLVCLAVTAAVVLPYILTRPPGGNEPTTTTTPATSTKSSSTTGHPTTTSPGNITSTSTSTTTASTSTTTTSTTSTSTTTTAPPPPPQCVSATNFTQAWRTNYSTDSSPGGGPHSSGGYACDLWTNDIWFRFAGAAGVKMLDSCKVSSGSCGTKVAFWSDQQSPSDVGVAHTIKAYGSYTQCRAKFSNMSVIRCSKDDPNDLIYRYLGEIQDPCVDAFCGMN